MYLPRNIDKELDLWRQQKEGKPLLIRGARQVGKSTAVRELSRQFEYFLEVNFEQQLQVHKLFERDLDPKVLCENLSILYNVPVVPGKTLLFFDEVQSCIPAISALRFFYEQYPALHVIAAGSLLEFALAAIPSFGVGRIRSLFVYPLCFDEYLAGIGEKMLLDAKKKATIHQPLAEPLHQKLLNHVKRFLVIGGMPEVVSSYVKSNNISQCGQILDDLITSLKTDFAKYKRRVPFLRISGVFDSAVLQAGNKFNYAKAATGANHGQIKEAVELLIMAGLLQPVTQTAANGLPLGAEANPKKRKLFLLDTGIFQRLLGLSISDIILGDDFDLINKGAIAEQFVGLELLKSYSSYQKGELYFWHREAKSSNAEVDYVIQRKEEILPIEVKSGKKGSMQSLFLFMAEKESSTGIRISLENYSTYSNIQVYPIYGVPELLRGEF